MAKEKAVKEAVKINSNIATQYALLIESGENNNTDALNFILEVGNEMGNGATTREVKESMKQALNGVNVKPVVLPNHVDALQTACLIISRFKDEVGEIKASKVLSLAVRVNADKKASGAKAHVASAKTYAELDEKTLSKKESQERDASAKPKAETAKPIGNVAELVSAMYLGITKFKPVGQLDEQGLKELGAITAWAMTLKNNQAVKATATK